MATKQEQSSSKTLNIVLVIVGIIAVLIFMGVITRFTMFSATNKLNEQAEELRETTNDLTRKSDLAKIYSDIYEYEMNNNGKLPNSTSAIKGYLSVSSDPDGESYDFDFSKLEDGQTKSVTTFDHTIYFVSHAECDDDKAVYSSSARDFALLYRLENKTTYCYSE